MALQISEKQIAGVTVLGFVGRITLGDESNQVRTKIKEVLGKGKSQIVLDLAAVSYITMPSNGLVYYNHKMPSLYKLLYTSLGESNIP